VLWNWLDRQLPPPLRSVSCSSYGERHRPIPARLSLAMIKATARPACGSVRVPCRLGAGSSVKRSVTSSGYWNRRVAGAAKLLLHPGSVRRIPDTLVQSRKEVVFCFRPVPPIDPSGSHRPVRRTYTHLAKGILFLELLPATVGTLTTKVFELRSLKRRRYNAQAAYGY
jgi:hypothetical protein